MPRRFPIFQFPNRPLIATFIAAAVARLTDGPTRAAAELISRLALLVWAAEEIVSGANWWRRLLGLGGASYALRELSQTPRNAAGESGSAAPTGATASAP